MKITHLDATAVDVGQGFLWANVRATEVIGVHVHIQTDQGISGDGLAWTAALPAAVVAAAIRTTVAPALIGVDPWATHVALSTAWQGFRVGLPLAVIGVVDVALWDLKGRLCSQPIANLLGRRHDRLRGCASAPPAQTIAAAETMIDAILEQGFKAIKLHACGDVVTDLAVCEAAREQVGDGIDLMMDAMGIYDRQQATRLGHGLDALDFRWYEDPLADDDLDGWVALAATLDTPLAGVDAVRFTTRDYARPMADGAFDIVRMDAARQGISQIDSLSRMAHAFALGCEAHAFGPALAQAANLQVGLASACSGYCELPVPLGALDHGVVQGLRLDGNGDVLAPAGPGLGLEVDREALARARVD